MTGGQGKSLGSSSRKAPAVAKNAVGHEFS